MTARHRVTLLIVRDQKLLVIRRLRHGRAFFVIPGGGVEDGESLTAAAVREAHEETGLAVTLGPQVWSRPFTTRMDNGELIEQVEHAYLITEFRGTPTLNLLEFPRHSADNRYELDWITVEELAETAVYPGPFPETARQTLWP